MPSAFVPSSLRASYHQRLEEFSLTAFPAPTPFLLGVRVLDRLGMLGGMMMGRKRLMLTLGQVLAIGGLGALGFEVGYYWLRAYGRIAGAVYPELRPVALMSVAVGLGLVVFASLRPTDRKAN